ncbi:hypothetical protein [Pikeienuella sp. HZG-20]|uniref:hypothetical protein n=1 Tax=Paludibacillus litoralis TaxID=3133267 RepID=UPI0030EB1DCE
MAALRDLASNLSVVESIRPAVHTATIEGETVDMRGYSSAMFAISVGAVAGSGDFTLKLEESDNGSGWTDVAAGDIAGTLPAALAANTALKVGYHGSARYVRATSTKNSGTSVAHAALAVLGHAAQAPAA